MKRSPRHTLVAEADRRDAELTLAALEVSDLAHTVAVVTALREKVDSNVCYQHETNTCVVKPADLAKFAQAIKRHGDF